MHYILKQFILQSSGLQCKVVNMCFRLGLQLKLLLSFKLGSEI